MPISKLQAAERQLNCAIRMYFADYDVLAVHTLSRAAFRILFDIYPERSTDGFERDVDSLINKLGWQSFNRVANFLKHADKDPDNVMEDGTEADTQMGLGFVLILHCRISKRYTPETKAFDMWMHVLNPDVFKVPPDSDPEIEKGYRNGIEYLKGADKAPRLAFGNVLVEYYRQNPDKLIVSDNAFYRRRT